MNPKTNFDSEPYRTPVPADVDAPDKILYGLTFRQLSTLAAVAVVLVAAWHALHHLLPAPVLLAAGGLVMAGAVGVVLGRRDGLPLQAWLAAALRFARNPRTLSPLPTVLLPPWVDPPGGRVALPALLRLPATAISDTGHISLGGHRVRIVAASTVNLALRTSQEQAALVDAAGRWLNSLTSPTQIVVSAQPVDLARHAHGLAARAPLLPHPALGRACADHAVFLKELAARRDPLRRQVLIATRTPTAALHGDDPVRGLAGLGVTARALDAAAATAALAGCADPYRPPRPTGLAPPDTVLTGTPERSNP